MMTQLRYWLIEKRLLMAIIILEGVVMGWSGYDYRIFCSVDAHGGDKELRGEVLRQQFYEEIEALIQKYNAIDADAFHIV